MPDLGSDLLLFLKEGHSYDLTLVCNGGERVKVHRLILVARSVVFQSMMDADMEEKRTGIVEIMDFDMEVVAQFVNFLYSDKIDENFSDQAELLKIGHKYQVSSLVDACSKRLAQQLTPENVVLLGSLAESYQASQLSSKCAEFLTKNIKEVDLEKLDTAPAPFLRKALLTKDKDYGPPYYGEKVCLLPVDIKTQYPVNFYTQIASPRVVDKDIPLETDFQVSRETNLAGVGLYIRHDTYSRIPIEMSLIIRLANADQYNPNYEHKLMSVSTEVSTYSIRNPNVKPLKLMFPISVSVEPEHEYTLRLKFGMNTINTTPGDIDGEQFRVSIQTGKENLVVNTLEPCQIPILYFED